MGDALSHHVGWKGWLIFAALFVPIWQTWTAFTFYSNRFVIDDFVHRAIVFAQMFAIGGMAVTVGDVFAAADPSYLAHAGGGATGDPQTHLVPSLDVALSRFFACYIGARLALVAMYWRAWKHVQVARALTQRFWSGFLAAVGIWLVAIMLPRPWSFFGFGLAVAIEFSIPLNRKARELTSRFPPDVLHAAERYGLLTIIVLGESFVKVLTAVSDKGLSMDTAMMASLSLAITCSLWWIYFDDVAGSRIKRTRIAAVAWVYLHLPLTIAVTATGVAIKKLALLNPDQPPGAKYVWLICGTLALVLLTVGAIDSITERRQAELSDTTRVRIRLGSAALVLLFGLIGASLNAVLFVALVASVMIAQVFLDLSFSPEFHDHTEAEHEDHAMFAREGELDLEPEKPRRPDISAAVRKGAPSELRRDLYFHLMEASWTQLLFWVIGLFLFTNVVFAALYMLEPWGVHGLSADSFLEAFSFSVQTLATIGFGAMYPDSGYAHGLVAFEALIGLLGVALVTGLVFAKAARPTPSVLFSKYPVITTRDGKPTLMFRVGNARGNDVVDATMKVVALKAEVSAEGHSMRRLHDLKLVRDNQPLFSLSWTIMHVIDEGSPLHDLDDDLALLVAILTGHDATYGQTIHARCIYEPDTYRFGHRMVDVTSTLEDGRLQIDYTKFHLTEPDPAAD